MRWLDEEKNKANFHIGSSYTSNHWFIIGLSLAIGLSSTQCAATFLGSITTGLFGCTQSWDSVQGGNGICCQQETNLS